MLDLVKNSAMLLLAVLMGLAIGLDTADTAGYGTYTGQSTMMATRDSTLSGFNNALNENGLTAPLIVQPLQNVNSDELTILTDLIVSNYTNIFTQTALSYIDQSKLSDDEMDIIE